MSSQKLFIIVLIVVLNDFRINARICPDVHSRNNADSLEKMLRGCTIVVGDVFIALHEIYSPNYHYLSFPDLREITGFLSFFRVHHLKSLTNLFPNLAIIRGDSLLAGYAFVIYDLPSLQEINLYNLRYIEKGSTRIDECPKLCYVNTVNWDAIGGPSHSLDYFNLNTGDCGLCTAQCNDYCWGEDRCQDTQPMNCGAHCLICNQSNKTECISCKSSHYLNEGNCVAECPPNKLRNAETRTCMTEHDCQSHFKGTWWAFLGECTRKCPDGYEKVPKERGRCRHCGEYCKKECGWNSVMVIENTQTANLLYKCTHIRGSLVISGDTEGLGDELNKSLSDIREIDGYLKIHRMNAFNSLDFLKNLRVIKGSTLNSNTYALIVLSNDNLHTLWTSRNISLKIEEGKVYFRHNPQLCFSEIERFLNKSGITEYSDFDISRSSNGDRKSCEQFNLSINFKYITSQSTLVQWEKISFANDDMTIAYVLHYTPDPFENITLFSERYECSSTSWQSVSVTNNFYNITSLTPFTTYACYIEIQTMQRMFKGHTGLSRFRTLPAAPNEVENVQVMSTENSILLKWSPPSVCNGVLFHYEISAFKFNEKSDFHKHRDYCKNPPVFVDDSEIDYVALPTLTMQNIVDDSNCCEKKSAEKEEPEDPVLKIDLSSIKDTIKTNSTRLELTSLRYFQAYILFLKACNAAGCSNSTLIHQRTKPNQHADDIPVDIQHFVEEANVSIWWLEPITPNADIVSYVLEYRRTDINDTISIEECVTVDDYLKTNSHTITNLPRGRYALSIKAVSLAGRGRASKYIEFEILVNLGYDNSFSVKLFKYVIGVICILVVLGASYFYYYFIFIRDINFENNATVSVESLNQLSRDDIEIDVLTGIRRIATGRIYNGFIKSQNRPCTVISGRKCNHNYGLLKYLKEVSNLKVCNTHHVAYFLGVVTTVQPPLIVFELMACGDLKSFLKKAKNFPEKLSDIEMYRMAAEIADGIMYFHSKNIVLHDLAVRNCLVSAGQTVKIVNFSIAKDLYKNDYHRRNGQLIPVRWMAPESLANNLITYNSNIWSYGIVLWEIVTFAEQPYGDLPNKQIANYVLGKNVLGHPEGCPDLLYEMMVACWRWKPRDRPTFVDILQQLLSNISENFELVSFYHSRAAREYRKSVETEKEENDSPILGKKTVIRWKKTENEEEQIELIPAEEVPKQNLPSTSFI